MASYEHITKMEKIMHDHEKLVAELGEFLDRLEERQEDYRSLVEYYYSDQRREDLEADERQLIPQTLCRGVLSEDEIYDLMGEYYTASLRMMELGLKILQAK